MEFTTNSRSSKKTNLFRDKYTQYLYKRILNYENIFLKNHIIQIMHVNPSHFDVGQHKLWTI